MVNYETFGHDLDITASVGTGVVSVLASVVVVSVGVAVSAHSNVIPSLQVHVIRGDSNVSSGPPSNAIVYASRRI